MAASARTRRAAVVVALATLTAAAGCSGASTAQRPRSATRTDPAPAPSASASSGVPSSTTSTGPSSRATTATSGPGAASGGATSGGSATALVAALQRYFASGCEGGCTPLTEPPSAFSVVLDQHDPSWARWSVVDPSIGSGYGFAHVGGGAWGVVAGPGSGDVGCPPSAHTVPAPVLADFGDTCPAA